MIRRSIEMPKKILICPACGKSDYSIEYNHYAFPNETPCHDPRIFCCKICKSRYYIANVILNS